MEIYTRNYVVCKNMGVKSAANGENKEFFEKKPVKKFGILYKKSQKLW